MMHKKNFVAVVKVNGKVLRESSDRVELPFGSEYSVLLKNLDTVRQQAKISIDGQDATGWLILGPNSDIEVERFVKDLDRGNRFKFIERTEKIENHRGVKAEDGLIRIEFRREKVYDLSKITEHHTYHHHYNDYYYSWPYPWNHPYKYRPTWTCNVTASNFSGALQSSGSDVIASCNMLRSAQQNQTTTQNFQCSAQNLNDAGITVPGSLSDQKFVSVSGFETEQSEVIVLHLFGTHGKLPVKVARIVEHKLSCDTCGKRNLPTAKFCIECGTSLEKF
jgi:hypothetical protein